MSKDMDFMQVNIRTGQPVLSLVKYQAHWIKKQPKLQFLEKTLDRHESILKVKMYI